MPADGAHFAATAPIHARPEIVWDILTDYHRGHPNILPPGAFSDFRVTSGGVGAGTATSFVFHVSGARQAVRHIVSVPTPGQTLVEAEPDGASRTTFTLAPLADGAQTQVTITTIQARRGGARGVIERLMTPLLAPAMRRIYLDELRRLDALAQRWPVGEADA
ncbi:MAG TPA: SRPBCC family protein [Ktedonobacterales bacterium]